MGLVACKGPGAPGGKEIVFADAGWESIKFHNAVAGIIAQEIFGYTWTEIPEPPL